ncbi:MAG: MarC family protein, partial [Gammaproteobacteria bacterium]|nr:MarC family protein [Gammaproteobacteria bacterium]
FIAGPGAIATIMLLMSEHHDDWIAQALIIATMAVVVLIALVLFIISGAAARYLAPSVTTVISRLLGMLLAALSIQFVIDGLKTAFKL